MRARRPQGTRPAMNQPQALNDPCRHRFASAAPETSARRLPIGARTVVRSRRWSGHSRPVGWRLRGRARRSYATVATKWTFREVPSRKRSRWHPRPRARREGWPSRRPSHRIGERVVVLGPLDSVAKYRGPPVRLVGGANQKIDCASRSIRECQSCGHARWRAARLSLSRSNLVTTPSRVTGSSRRDATALT